MYLMQMLVHFQFGDTNLGLEITLKAALEWVKIVQLHFNPTID